MEYIDVAIIGAGVVGLAIASEVAQPGKEVYVFERHREFGRETSDRNSKVIHAGLYYPKGSLKGKLCVEGRNLIYDIGANSFVPVRNTGKLIVAVDKSEIPTLENIAKTAEGNGVSDLQMLTSDEVHDLEADVNAVAAIYSPSTGILNVHKLMEYFILKAKDKSGGLEPILYEHEIAGIDKLPDGYKITFTDPRKEPVATRVLINSAGLFSDKIAAMAGIDVASAGYQLHYCKGEYFALSHKHHNKLKHLVYPVPEEAGLGVHATLDLEGEIKLGPNAFYMDDLYTEITAKDGSKRRIIDYSIDSGHQQEFFESARRFLGFLKSIDEIGMDQAGIRPKLQGPGEGFRDFIIMEESDKGFPGLINLIGIESPALTAAPAIGKYVAAIVNELV